MKCCGKVKPMGHGKLEPMVDSGKTSWFLAIKADVEYSFGGQIYKFKKSTPIEAPSCLARLRFLKKVDAPVKKASKNGVDVKTVNLEGEIEKNVGGLNEI
jgi:hypothetical protein